VVIIFIITKKTAKLDYDRSVKIMPVLVPYYFATKFNKGDQSRIGHLPLPVGRTDAEITSFVDAYELLSTGDNGDPCYVFGVTESIYNTYATQGVNEANDLETANPVGMNCLIVNLDGATGVRRTLPLGLKGLDPMAVAVPPVTGTAALDIYKSFLINYARLVHRTAGVLTPKLITEVVVSKVYAMH